MSAPHQPDPSLPWAQEGGEGPLVALVHGGLDRASGFGRVARQLPDHRVLRYDRRGYAHSRSLGVGTLDDHVDDLRRLLAGRPATVVGHSVGAVVGLALAARHPTLVRSVGAFEPPLPWLPEWPRATPGGEALRDEDPAEGAERFLRRMIGDERWERLPARTREERRAEGPALRADLASVRTAPFRPEEVRAPVVVGWGSAAAPHHAAAARHLVAELPRAEVHVIEGAGHGAHLTHPSAFADLVRHAVRLGASPG